MTLEILLCVLVAQIIINFLQYLSLRRILIEMNEEESSVDVSQQQMAQIENDLNTRLREIQTSQFSPRMSRPFIRLVKQEGDD